MKAKLTITRVFEIQKSTDSRESTPGDILDLMIMDASIEDCEEFLNKVEFEFTDDEILSARKTIQRKVKRVL